MNYPNPIFNPNPDRNSAVQRQDWYSCVALADDRTRPRYPQQILAKLAGLPTHAQMQMLEIGC